MNLVNVLLLIIGVSASIGIVSYLMLNNSSRDYSLSVDAMRDDQSLFVSSRVIVTNTGKLPLTNLTVNYGIKNETLVIIHPGEKISLSPPEGSNLNFVKITGNNGINITSEYRRPIKLPGMMGS